MRERRKWVRADVSANVKWARDIDAKDTGHEAVTKNIGGGGICLTTKEKLEVGDRLVLEIELPEKEIISSKGRVVWINEFEIIGVQTQKGFYAGVEFLNITEEDRAKVEKCVYEYRRNIRTM